MHNNWEEMIPFYIAGTLPKNETTRLENHLSRCDECRKALDDWRSIAGAVRADAASHMRDLPPLSSHVLRMAAQQAGGRPSHPIAYPSFAPPRYNPASVTLVAALFTVVLFGAVLGFLVLRGALPQPGMDVANLPTATETATDSPSPTPVASQADPTEPPQIIVIEPSATPLSPTPIPPSPTVVLPTRLPPTAALPPTVIQPPTLIIPTSEPLPSVTPTEEQMFSLLLAPPLGDACTLQVAVPGAAVNLYAGPGIDFAIVAALSQESTLTALGRVESGWYRAEYAPDGVTSVVGWVRQDQVFLSGACDALPLLPSSDSLLETPTPTETVLPFPSPSPSPTPGIASGSWSRTVTLLSTTCVETPASGAATPLSLSVSGDAITVSAADTGAFVVQRIGEQTFAGSYSTASATVSVSLTFASSDSYAGSAVATETDGCVTRSVWSGVYAGS